MKIIKRGLGLKAAIELANQLALETGLIHSVRIGKTIPVMFYVVSGMVGNEACHYVARPETLRSRGPDKGPAREERRQGDDNRTYQPA